MKQSFFAHFCAGESDKELEPTLKLLQANGVGGILDYAAEADVPSQTHTQTHASAPAHRSTSGPVVSQEDAELNANLAASIAGVRAAARVGGFAAVKMTSIATPELLRHMSSMLEDHRRAFRRFNVRQVANPYLDMHVPEAVFLGVLKGPRIADDDARDLFRIIDYGQDGAIDYREWTDVMALMRLGVTEAETAALHAVRGGTPASLLSLLVPAATVGLATEEQRKLRDVLRRADELAAEAHAARVTIMMDAEQTYLQPAIDFVTMHMMRQYNRADPRSFVRPEVAHLQGITQNSLPPRPALVVSTRVRNERASGGAYPAVYNTYQAYRRDTPSRLAIDLRRSAAENFLFGAKLVRGAYMLQERRLAKEKSYRDPIHPDIQATHGCYDECIQRIVDLIPTHQPEVMVASHNEASVLKAATRIRDMGLHPQTCGVSFGQLLGMCDHITYSLAGAGYKVFKYVPYGPVTAVLPYLIRRAEENSDLLNGGVAKELKLLQQELRRRVWS